MVADEFSKILKTWFKNSNELKTTINSFSEVLLNEGAYVESIFLNIVQTLEHFYGLVFPGESRLLTRNKWSILINQLKNCIPEALKIARIDLNKITEYSTQIVNRIAPLNKVSFRSKLERLFTEMPGRELMPILNNPNDPNKAIQDFLKKVEDTRNFLVHYDKKLAKNSFFNKDLQNACATCWAVLNFWLAKKLGFSDEAAGEIAFKAKRAMFLVSRKSGL